MKLILKKILIGCIIIIVAMALLPTLIPLYVTGQAHSIAEEYLFWISHPFKWIGFSVLMIILIGLALLLISIFGYVVQKLSGFLLNKSKVNAESNDFHKIYSGLGFLIFLVGVFCFDNIVIEPSPQGLISCGTNAFLALWALFSMLYSKSGLAIVRSYFLAMSLYFGYVLLKIICLEQEFTVTWRTFDTDFLSQDFLPTIFGFVILGLFIKGFIITYRPGFIKAFPHHKEISYFQILILISAISCLVLLRSVSFDLSINNTDNNYPAINSTK